MTQSFRILCLLFLSLTVKAQSVFRIVSAEERTAVEHAACRLSKQGWQAQQMADLHGKVTWISPLEDSAHYVVEIQALGYLPHVSRVQGKDLNSNPTFSLQADPKAVEEVVVTAQYAPVQAEASLVKVTVIDSKRIEQMGAVTLRDVLTNSLNIRLSQDNVLGSSMSLQGLGGQNIKFLIDGVPVIGRQNGNIDLSQINLNSIERIEIVEGPLSVQYGTDALAGTINLITKARANFPGRKLQLATQYESIGQYNFSLQGQYKIKRSAINGSFARNYFDGWSEGDPQFSYVREAKADSQRFQTWKPREQYLADLGYSYRLEHLTLSARSSYFWETILNRGMPMKPYNERAFDDEYKTQRLDNNVQLNGKLGRNWNINALAAYNYYLRNKNTYVVDLTTLDKTLSASASDQDTSMFDLLMSRANFTHAKDSSRLSCELGYDLNQERAEGKRIEDKQKSIGDYALFGTLEYKLGAFAFKPGLRVTHNTQYQAPLVPSLNIRFAPGLHHTFRASYAKGFRAPSLKELYFDFVDINHNIVGTGDLKAEQSHNLSGSWNYRLPLGQWALQSEASAFYNYVDNLIALALISGTQYTYANIGNYQTKGIRWIGKAQHKRWQLQVGATYTGRYNELASSEDIPSFSYSPEFNGVLNHHFPKPQLTISMFYKYNGRMPSYQMQNDQLVQTFIDPYQMLDLTLQKAFGKQKVMLTIGCKNLLNVTSIKANQVGGVHSSSSSSVSMAAGRNYFLKVIWNLFD